MKYISMTGCVVDTFWAEGNPKFMSFSSVVRIRVITACVALVTIVGLEWTWLLNS